MAVLPTSTRRLYIQTCQAEILECLARNILWHIPGAPTRGPNAYPSVFSLHQHPEKHIFQAIYLAESGSLELCASRRRVRAQKLKMHSPPLMLPSPAVPCPQPQLLAERRDVTRRQLRQCICSPKQRVPWQLCKRLWQHGLISPCGAILLVSSVTPSSEQQLVQLSQLCHSCQSCQLCQLRQLCHSCHSCQSCQLRQLCQSCRSCHRANRASRASCASCDSRATRAHAVAH